MMADGGKSEDGEVNENKARNLLFLPLEPGFDEVSCRWEPRLMYNNTVMAIRLDERERSSRKGRMMSSWS